VLTVCRLVAGTLAVDAVSTGAIIIFAYVTVALPTVRRFAGDTLGVDAE